MSDYASTPIPATPRTITDRLSALRRKILTWLVIDGLSKLCLLLIGLLAFDLLVDWLFQLDVAQRIIMLSLMIIALAFGAYFWLVRPLRHRPNDDALCLQVESKHKTLRQAVISALQFSRMDVEPQAGVSMAMVAATVEQGGHAAEDVDFGQVVDNNRFVVNSTLLGIGVLLIALGAIGISQKFLNLDIWFNRNILLQSVDWPRQTYLEVEGIRDDNTILLTRGEDHNQRVRILETSKIIPEKLFIEFRDGGSRSMEEMTPVGESTDRFELLFRNVSSRFQFRAVGGKDGRSDWIQVELVDPPSVDQLTLTITPPAYTQQDDYKLPSGSGPYNILEGSSMKIEGTTNKPLQEATISVGSQEWPLEMASKTRFSYSFDADELLGGKYQFNFLDEDNIRPSRPDTFSIRITSDRAPRILASTYGISGMVVPRVRIPLEGTFTDDFAITHINLTYEWRGLDNATVPQTGTIDFRGLGGFYGDSEIPFRDLFDLEPEQIPAGAGLKFTLNAVDNCAIGEQNVGHSSEFLLRVVTESELRTDLLRREKEQRQELERLLKTQEDLLIESTAMLADVRTAEPELLESLRSQFRGDLLEMSRSQNVVGTNIATIASNFRSFLDEVINNRIDEEEGTLQERLLNQIIVPLEEIDMFEVQDAVRGMDLARRVVQDNAELEAALQSTVDQQRAIVRKMQGVLDSMVKAEGYQEAVNLLNEIKRAEEEVHQLTKERREQRLRELLEQGGNNQSDDDDSDDGDSDDSDSDGEDDN